MPPPEAVAGTYVGPDGKKIKVAPLSDEDRRTLIRWIDLGCSIDLRFDPQRTDPRTSPFADRTLPTLTVAHPRAGVNSGAVVAHRHRHGGRRQRPGHVQLQRDRRLRPSTARPPAANWQVNSGKPRPAFGRCA